MATAQVYDTIVRALELSFSYLTNPGKRTYFVYILSSVALAYYVYYKTKPKTSFLQFLVPKKVWFTKSALVDFWFVIFNSFFKIIVIGPYLIAGLYIAFYVDEFLVKQFGEASFSLNKTQTLIFYTITLTILNDFFTYVIHLAMHKIPFLWEFHKIHHSATQLNPFTQYRIHPIELIINNAKGVIVFGFLTGIFDFYSNHQVDKLMFLGVNVFGFIFMFLGANLRHSHIKLTYPAFIEKIFISPFQHQIHHSNNPIHFDKNMGSKLAIWDWLFGTLVLSKATKQIAFGLGEEDPHFTSFWKNLSTPFKNILNKLFKANN